MEFIKLDKEQFKQLQDNFLNSNYCQTVSWGDLKAITGWQSHYVGVIENNQFVCLALLIWKQKYFLCPKRIFN